MAVLMLLAADLHLAWIDVVGLALVGLLALLGFARGLWWQVVRLLGLVVALAVARALGPRIDPHVQELLPEVSSIVVGGVTRLVLFVLVLVGVALIGFVGKKSIDTMKLGFADRFGGLLAGVLSGLVVHGVVVVMLAYFGGGEWSRGVFEGTVSRRLLEALSEEGVISPSTSERVEPVIDRGEPVDDWPPPSPDGRRVR